MIRCSICKFPIRETDPATTCAECGEQYHTDCWESIGGCATYGCGQAATPDEKPMPETVGQGWGDEKQCPNCRASIASGLLICPNCQAKFPYAEPMSRMEFREWERFEKERRDKRLQLVGLFVLSLFVLPAPVLGAIAGVMAYQNRREMIGDYGAYLALGYGTAVIGVITTVVLFLLAIG